MADSKRSVVQEVQKELLAAMQRGYKQVRKGQDRVREGQEQVRRGRDTVVGVVRAGTELAKAARPSVPTRPTVHIPGPAEIRAHAQELAEHAISVQRDLAGKAWHATSPHAERVVSGLAERARHAGLAEQAATAQRTLADKVAEAAKAASPFVAEGRTRLTQLVGALQGGHPTATAPAAADKVSDAATTATAPTTDKPAAAKPTAAKPAAAKRSTANRTAAKATTAASDKSTATAAKPKARTTKSAAPRSAASKPRSTDKK